MTFGQFIKLRRLELGLTTYEAAERAGMKPTVWSNWENNRSRRSDGEPASPRRETMTKIAYALQLPDSVVANWAIGMTENMDPTVAEEVTLILAGMSDERKRLALPILRALASA